MTEPTGGSSVDLVILTVTVNPAIDVVTAAPHVVPVGKLRCTPPRRVPGGGGINVSRTIASLGGSSAAVFTSGGLTGARLEASLADLPGVACRPVPIAGETRENLLVREEASGREWHFVMPGPALTEPEWRAVIEAVATTRPAPDYVVASGSLPRGVPEDFFASLAPAVAAQGGRLVLDAHGEPLRHALEHGVWMVKPNVGELAELTGEELDDEPALEAAARRYVDSGACEVMVLSLGRGGAILFVRGERSCRLRTPVVRQASRVGAGDAMVAATVLALDRGAPLRAAVQAGLVAGAATVRRPAFEPARGGDVAALAAQLDALPHTPTPREEVPS